MRIAVTGATGFIGHYIVRHLIDQGHTCRCWCRPVRQRSGFDGYEHALEWLEGELGDETAGTELVKGCQAVVHGALYRPGTGFRGAEGEIVEFARRNVLGSLMLIEAARRARVPRFVFISTCAVHEVILEDRKLDEAHPMWSNSIYGAHKAAVEEFVYAYGIRDRYEICAIRPTGVYGLHHDPCKSKWYELVHALAQGDLGVLTDKGGKEVHAADVARAVGLVLTSEGTAGQAYNCYDRYISQQDIAAIVLKLTHQQRAVERTNTGPKHQIDTAKLRALGMRFGGVELLESTIGELLQH